MSLLSMFFIVAFVIFVLAINIVSVIDSDALSTVIWRLAGLAAAISFMICIIISVITDYLAKDYLTDVGKVIENKEIVEVQVSDRLFQDNVTITYKDSNSDLATYDTTLPWYCDITVEQAEEPFIKIDSSHNTFYVYTNALGTPGGTYTSKK